MTIKSDDLNNVINIMMNPEKYGYKDCAACGGFGEDIKKSVYDPHVFCTACEGEGVVPIFSDAALFIQPAISVRDFEDSDIELTEERVAELDHIESEILSEQNEMLKTIDAFETRAAILALAKDIDCTTLNDDMSLAEMKIHLKELVDP
jgi:hypothetical protein